MVEHELIELGQHRADGVLANVPIRSPRELAVAERRRAGQPAQAVVHAERHHGGNQHLTALSFGHLATHQMREVPKTAGPAIDLVDQVAERDEGYSPFESALESLGPP